MIKISTSILSAKDRISSILKLNNTNTDYLHIDVMDNIFVPNYQFPVEEINEICKHSNKPLDIHLMVTNPIPYIKAINNNNINNITIHLEIDNNLDTYIKLIKSYNYKVGIAIKPNTDINLIKKYINVIDIVLIMSVEPGFGGQQFIDNSVDRIQKIRAMRKDITIEIDGGINNETINKIKDTVDVAVSGSYITSSINYQEAIDSLRK